MTKVKSKGKLASALASTTTRLHNNAQHREREQGVQLAASKPSSSRATRKNAQLQRTKAAAGVVPFAATDRVLLIGEGDFSFARALVRDEKLGIVPANVIATTLDQESELKEKYPETLEANVEELKQKGVFVLCNVDATKLEACKALRGRTFDKVVWNFPHVGKGIADQDRNIRENQEALVGFLNSVQGFLATGTMPTTRKRKRGHNDERDDDPISEDEDADVDPAQASRSGTRGTVLITLRDAPPYSLWDLPRLAKRPPSPSTARYTLLRSFPFARTHWRVLGYAHRMTKGHVKGIAVGQSGMERTWEFALADPEPAEGTSEKPKQKAKATGGRQKQR